jgi:hypothetical protein
MHLDDLFCQLDLYRKELTEYTLMESVDLIHSQDLFFHLNRINDNLNIIEAQIISQLEQQKTISY